MKNTKINRRCFFNLYLPLNRVEPTSRSSSLRGEGFYVTGYSCMPPLPKATRGFENCDTRRLVRHSRWLFKKKQVVPDKKNMNTFSQAARRSIGQSVIKNARLFIGSSVSEAGGKTGGISRRQGRWDGEAGWPAVRQTPSSPSGHASRVKLVARCA